MEFRMSTCHSNGNRNSDFKLSLAYTCLHLGLQHQAPALDFPNGHCVFWALCFLDTVFSPEMSFS